MENQSQAYQQAKQPKTFVIECNDFLVALNYLKQTVDQTFDSNDKEYDYHRGIFRGIDMVEELAREFFIIEQKNKIDLSKKPEGLKNGISFSNY